LKYVPFIVGVASRGTLGHVPPPRRCDVCTQIWKLFCLWLTGYWCSLILYTLSAWKPSMDIYSLCSQMVIFYSPCLPFEQNSGVATAFYYWL